MRIHNLRLQPEDDVKKSLQLFAATNNVSAASIVSAVGSLSRACLRFAGEATGTSYTGPFEIVSLSGTLSKHGMHIHLSASDKSGKTLGGHLMEGCLIHTTLELVILEQTNVKFLREKDPVTGYLELVINPISDSKN